jgi:hypothetical protein
VVHFSPWLFTPEKELSRKLGGLQVKVWLFCAKERNFLLILGFEP